MQVGQSLDTGGRRRRRNIHRAVDPSVSPPQIPAQSRGPLLSDRTVVKLSKQSSWLLHASVSSSQNVGWGWLGTGFIFFSGKVCRAAVCLHKAQLPPSPALQSRQRSVTPSDGATSTSSARHLKRLLNSESLWGHMGSTAASLQLQSSEKKGHNSNVSLSHEDI